MPLCVVTDGNIRRINWKTPLQTLHIFIVWFVMKVQWLSLVSMCISYEFIVSWPKVSGGNMADRPSAESGLQRKPSVDHCPQLPRCSAAIISEGTAVIWVELLNVQPLSLTFFLPTLLCTNGSHGTGMTGMMWVIGNGMSERVCVCICVAMRKASADDLKQLSVSMCNMSMSHPKVHLVSYSCSA